MGPQDQQQQQQARIPKAEISNEVQTQRQHTFKRRHGWLVAFFSLILLFHVTAIYLFLSGFLLTRLVLDHKSDCAIPPAPLDSSSSSSSSSSSYTLGSPVTGCWHPKSFDKAVVIIVDALRYDFTVPWSPKHPHQLSQHFHNALPIFWDTAVAEPQNAFLLPFIADPPTTTLQRLKGLTTGTLPTFIDAGSNFAGTAIEEDNLIAQLKAAGKRLVHLGDDTWQSLFPGYFDPELTRAYDSFNVWDLHTVDNGVNDHIFPLLHSTNTSSWDVIIGHYLGVDHAGHRYGPDHPAMASKLQEMNAVFERMIEALDDDTLLVVMGDHGMDAKGDHGGESDDEVEAALWMYSRKGLFGRRDKSASKPPFTAKERAVAQIDLVPTLSLMLGMPVPFNNLGRPIQEAFIGSQSDDYKNLAQVNHLTAAQIHRYQDEYSAVRKLDTASTLPPETLWQAASKVWDEIQKTDSPSSELWQAAYSQFGSYQQENLRVCKSLWARFDLTSMGMGISLLTGALLVIVFFSNGFGGDRAEIASDLCIRGAFGTVVGAGAGTLLGNLTPVSWINTVVFFAGMSGILGTLSCFATSPSKLQVPLPTSFWGWICTIPPVLLCIGFASNSFTIWEDEILLYMLCSIGALMLASSLRLQNPQERLLGSWHSLSFIVMTRLASLSRLCREEQMPFCRSTYYASATSSTSSWWQLAIPFIIAVILPSAIRDFFARTKNDQGTAVLWLSIAFRIGLVLSATYWILDAADDNEWITQISSENLKSIRVFIAQAILATAWAVGYSAYLYSAPFLGIETETPVHETEVMDPTNPNSDMFTPIKPQQRKKLIILGYANTHGTRYFLLLTIWALVLLLLQKPMGQGTLTLCLLSILNLLEVIDANDLRNSPLGPVTLALMASFYFFKTGHQATLTSIQWDSAFIPLKTIIYPWSPMLVIVSTFAPHILCALAVPAVVFWKVPPRTPGLMNQVAKALGTHMIIYAAIALATVVEAAWLRRHLMLYRIFMPRMLLGVVVLLVVELIGLLVGLVGIRSSIRSVAEAFGWGPLYEETTTTATENELVPTEPVAQVKDVFEFGTR
jgi:phosphatidylinositol glycan class O